MYHVKQLKRGEVTAISREVLAAREEDCTNYVSNEGAVDSADPLVQKPSVHVPETRVQSVHDARKRTTSRRRACKVCSALRQAENRI